jgi:hypothetical protein
MFAVLADTVEKKGVVCGFLGTVLYCIVLYCVRESLVCIVTLYLSLTEVLRTRKESRK